MRTLLNEPPETVKSWLQQRQALGQDLYDEMWEGVYHVAPAPHPSHGDLDEQLSDLLRPYAQAAGLRGSGPLNLGSAQDYRVPDRAYLRKRPWATYVSSVDIVIEIVSPNDETWDKLGFYFAHDVAELLIVDWRGQSVQWLARGNDTMERVDRSVLLNLSGEWLRAAIDWPPLD